MNKPLLYIYAFVFAAFECLHGKQDYQGYALIIDGLDPHIEYFGDSDEPVLLFIDKNRPLANFLVGCEMELEHRVALLDRCWRQYNERRARSLEGFDPTYRGVYKPTFLDSFRATISFEQKQRDAQQRAQQEAQERAEQVKKWLNAGADVNAIVQDIPDRPYNAYAGFTALRLAKAFNEDRIVQVLLEYGAEE